MDPRKRELIVKQIELLLFDMSEDEKEKVLREVIGLKEGIPLSIFTTELSCLESIVKYLKEELEMGFIDISKKLNRTSSNIRNTYQNSKKKTSKKLEIDNLSIFIPFEVIGRGKSVLEMIVVYLRDELELSFKEIEGHLHRSYSTIKTVYRRNNK